MAERVSRLNVLVASPSDVKAERDVAARVIAEVSRLLERQGIELRCKMWESDAVSQIGDRPQAIVNEQVADACDIFIGIMWSRIGTPTGEEVSGTIEEFRRAKARFDLDSRSVRILFFFCERPLPFALDIDQLTGVRKFRSELEQLGIISTFIAADEFEFKLRQAIHKHAVEWGETWGDVPSTDSEPQKTLPIGEDGSQADLLIPSVEEVGFLDAIDEGVEQSEVGGAAMQRIAEAINDLGDNIKQRTADLNKIAKHPPFDIKKIKRIANLAADHLEGFSDRLAAEMPIQQKAFSKSLERMSDVVLLSQDFTMDEAHRAELDTMRRTLIQLEGQMSNAISQTVEFRQSIINVPRMTTKYNSARRQAERVLNEFIEGVEQNLHLVVAIRNQIDKIIGDSE